MTMLIHTTIDHKARKSLELSVIEYAIADCIYQLFRPGASTDAPGAKVIAESLGIEIGELLRPLDNLKRKELIADFGSGYKITSNFYIKAYLKA